MRNKLIFLLSFVFIVGLILVKCSGDGSTTVNQPPMANTVAVKDNFFDPANMTVAMGTTVTWSFQGNAAHTVTSGEPGDDSAGSLFDNGSQSSGMFQFRFTQAGTFKYFCRIHGAAMTGTITVQ